MYEYDVVIDGGSIRKRKQKPSKHFRSFVRPHAAFHGRGHSVALPAAGGRYGSPRRSASYGGRQARGPSAPRRTPGGSDGTDHRRVGQSRQRDERHFACDVLNGVTDTIT